MVLKIFGFKSQLWNKKKSKEPTITILKYVQHSEFLEGPSYKPTHTKETPNIGNLVI